MVFYGSLHALMAVKRALMAVNAFPYVNLLVRGHISPLQSSFRVERSHITYLGRLYVPRLSSLLRSSMPPVSEMSTVSMYIQGHA